MTRRGTSPVIGIVLLLVVTVALAGTVATVAFETTPPSDAPRAAIDLRVDADQNRLTFVHRAGDPLDVRDLDLRVRVEGTPLDAQPPVPFFSASGFEPGPTGPFNSATDPEWTAGETASVQLAGTNDPLISEGSAVVVEFAVEDAVIAEASGTG